MLIDLLEKGKGVRCKVRTNASQKCEGLEEKYGALAYWEEHCVECGAPFCYRTCDKFSKTIGGKCRRFEGGVRPVMFPDGSKGYQVKFLPWGKLELHFCEMMTSYRWHRRLMAVDAVVGGIARFLSRVLPFLPWNRNPVSIVRSVRSFLLRYVPHRNQAPESLEVHCYAETPEKLRCSVVEKENGEIFAQEIHLDKGWNSVCLVLPPLPSDCYVRLFSIEGTSEPIIFTSLDLVVKPMPQSDVKSAKFVKCVAWDLDNTLWDGILVEDGSHGIRLRKKVLAVIKELDRRGVMNSICSKNDFELAWAELKRLGIEKFFVFPEISWNPKSDGVRAIAKNMNIGIDSMAFVDDSVHERGEVSSCLPTVRVFDVKQVSRLLELAEFCPPITEASSKRRQSYLEEMKRRKVESVFSGAREDFLRSCEISLTCEKLSKGTVARRCWELVNRTNQLTLAAHRYDEKEFDSLIFDKSVFSYAIRCKDKYGDYGIVGFIAVRMTMPLACVVEFVMSCRVAKKLCEQSVLMSLASRLRDRGVTMLSAEVVPTGRNGALIEAFDVMPFLREDVQGPDEQRRLRYVLNIGSKDKDLTHGVFCNAVEFLGVE